MLRILNAGGNTPIVHNVDLSAFFEPGNIATYNYREDSYGICLLPSTPVGIIDDCYTPWSTSISNSRIHVWVKQKNDILFETDKIDPTCPLINGSYVYCSEDGLFTTLKHHSGQTILGYIFSAHNRIVQIFWTLDFRLDYDDDEEEKFKGYLTPSGVYASKCSVCGEFNEYLLKKDYICYNCR